LPLFKYKFLTNCSADKIKKKKNVYNITQTDGDVKKGKAVPLQAWGGPEGSRKLRFPDFMTKW